MKCKPKWNDVVRGFASETTVSPILVELNLAILGCGTVKSAKGGPKADHNIENAMKAFSEGVRLLFDASLPRGANSEILDKLASLHAELHDLDILGGSAHQ